MSMSTNSSTFQTALILSALVAGALVTRLVPERHPFAAYVPPTQEIPTTAVFKHASTAKQDTSRDISGIDVDARRLALLGRIS